MIKSLKEFVIIGGGAAGMFAALAAKTANPSVQVTLLEKSAVLLAKVRVSGGGRCNVTHACFDPKELVRNYPRGNKELLGPYYRFQPQDTIDWFEARGVLLKTEEDGRVFPVTDSSQTIIDCLIGEARQTGVEFLFKQKIKNICYKNGLFEISCEGIESFHTPKLLLATGSSPEGHRWAEQLGHSIQDPVPSLFTFNIPHSPLTHLSGISWGPADVSLPDGKLSVQGSILITHFGLSGPAILKLSAWGSRFLHACHYQSPIVINWLPAFTEEALFKQLRATKEKYPAQNASTANPMRLPKNLWNTLLQGKGEYKMLALSDKELRSISRTLHHSVYNIHGKTTHKEEFVTCGGVSLQEIDFKTLQSKICPGLYFAGEILDIDGVTGGFNFQNAWTTGYIAGTDACS
jgi:predicted Rossmann fold flavoprotein